MIKALEINTSMLFSLDFAKKYYFIMLFLFFLIIDLNFLIPAAIAQNFNPTAELVILIGIPSKEGKAEIDIYPVIAEDKIKKRLI